MGLELAELIERHEETVVFTARCHRSVAHAKRDTSRISPLGYLGKMEVNAIVNQIGMQHAVRRTQKQSLAVDLEIQYGGIAEKSLIVLGCCPSRFHEKSVDGRCKGLLNNLANLFVR